MHPLLLLLTFILLQGDEAAFLKLPTWHCQQFPKYTGKIIGGREARPNSYPYMAFLLIQSPEGLSACGGFLVREDFVLTAGHCLGSSIDVTLGAHNIQRRERTQQHIPVLRAILHPDYNPQNIQNDIMLLQLRRKARRSRSVKPVALPQASKKVRPGDLCTVAGWGQVSQSRGTNVLQEVQLRIQMDQTCANRFQFYKSQIQICVGNPRERKSAFKGDSGGPLVCSNVAQGIVSYGSNNGNPPAVFTKIQSFMPWIKRTMRRLAP